MEKQNFIPGDGWVALFNSNADADEDNGEVDFHWLIFPVIGFTYDSECGVRGIVPGLDGDACEPEYPCMDRNCGFFRSTGAALARVTEIALEKGQNYIVRDVSGGEPPHPAVSQWSHYEYRIIGQQSASTPLYGAKEGVKR